MSVVHIQATTSITSLLQRLHKRGLELRDAPPQAPIRVYVPHELGSSSAVGVCKSRESLDCCCLGLTFGGFSILALAQLPFAFADHGHGAAEDSVPGVVFAAGGRRRRARASVL